MEADEVTEFIKNILGKSDSLQYCEHFRGISDAKFNSYSFEDLKRVLPSTDEGELAAALIKTQIEVALMMERLKAAKRAGGNVSSFFQPTETEGQTAGMDASGTGADEITIEIVPQKSTEIEIVTLDSDEEVDQSQDDTTSCDSSDEDDSDSEYVSTSESSSESDESDGYVPPALKRQRQIGLASTTGRPGKASKAKRKLNVGSTRRTTFKCEGPKVGRRNQTWYDEIHGQHCSTINAYQWCWQPLNHRCKYNLFRILRNSPNVKRLNLFSDVTDTPGDIDLPEGSLLELKKLLVHRRRKMNTGNLLRTILKMATNLKGFEYKFSNDTEEDLGLLGDFDWCNLERLAVFSLSSPSYLTKAHLEKLLRVRAPKLKKLQMGGCLFEDVSGDLLENVLKNFPTVQTLYIPGKYYSHADAHPAVVIDFPKLSQLRDLRLGDKYYYAAVGTDDDNDQSLALDQESPKVKPFHVTLKFCRILSKLKILALGNMYHIDSLHLKCFPKLEKLYVGSPWHLSVVFPEKNTLNYPLITCLQLPDGLNDASFLRNIPERFPNVKRCHLWLPSAHVLRTFFNVMKDVGLEILYLSTRFEFSSTLESCLLDEVRPIKNSSEDWKRVTELEQCEKWNEFVDQNNITLPLRNDEEVQSFVEATGEYGLGAMKQLDKLYLWHLPRILRLPLAENNEAATTSTVKLGYKQYPISTECCEVIRLTSTKFGWNQYLKEPAGGGRWREARNWASPDNSDADFGEIDAVPVIESTLKEEIKDE